MSIHITTLLVLLPYGESSTQMAERRKQIDNERKGSRRDVREILTWPMNSEQPAPWQILTVAHCVVAM